MKMRMVIGTIAAIVGIMLMAGQAQATPIGTSHVIPSIAACDQTSPQQTVSCAAAYVNRWLAHKGARGVVKETVLVGRPSAGVWLRPDLRVRCGFSSVPGVFVTSMHHCDGITFVDLNELLDRTVMSRKVWAIVVMAHESAHGMQERAGIDPVMPTIMSNKAAMFPLEQSADCWAGMAMRWYIQRGMLPSSARADGQFLMRGIGVEGERGHGSPGQRQAAFDAGYDRGAPACSAIVGRSGVFL